MEKQLQVGVISSTHGVRGEVKVFPTTDDVNTFQTVKESVSGYRERDASIRNPECEVF